jgi:hypothetical protein
VRERTSTRDKQTVCSEKEQAALLQVRAEQELMQERERQREREREREVMVQKQLEHRQAAARWEEAERAMKQELRVLREENVRLQHCVLSLEAAGERHLTHCQAEESRCITESAESNRAWTQRAGKANRKEGSENDGNEDVRGQARARAGETTRARERERDVRVAIVREMELKLSRAQGDVVGMAGGAEGVGGGGEDGDVRGEGRKAKEELEEEAEAQEGAREALWMKQRRMLLRGARSPVEGAEQGLGVRI